MPTLFRALSQVHGISRAWSESEYSLHCHSWVYNTQKCSVTGRAALRFPDEHGVSAQEPKAALKYCC